MGLGHGSSCPEHFCWQPPFTSTGFTHVSAIGQHTLPLQYGNSFEISCLLWILLCVGVISYCVSMRSRSAVIFAQDGSSSSFPRLLHVQVHTLQAVQCISRERKVFAKNTYAEVIYGLTHIDACGSCYTMPHKEASI